MNALDAIRTVMQEVARLESTLRPGTLAALNAQIRAMRYEPDPEGEALAAEIDRTAAAGDVDGLKSALAARLALAQRRHAERRKAGGVEVYSGVPTRASCYNLPPKTERRERGCCTPPKQARTCTNLPIPAVLAMG